MEKKTINQKGLSLLEALVAISAFVIVISVALTLFTTGIGSQRKIIAQQNVQDNAMFLLNFMAKEIRMGIVTSYNPPSTLTIERTDPQDPLITYYVTYLFDGTNIQRSTTGANPVTGPINSNNVLVSGRFYAQGKGINPGDNHQPRVTIVIRVETTGTKAEQRAVAELQTTLSQHKLGI